MARRLLTDKRERWVKNRNVVLKGKVLRNNIRLEASYAKQLERLADVMIRDTEKLVDEFLDSTTSKDYFALDHHTYNGLSMNNSSIRYAFYAMDASIATAANRLINKLQKRYEKFFNEKAKISAKQMVNGADKTSKTSLHSSLEKLSGGLSIKTDILTTDLREVLKATVQENVALIKTVPQEYLGRVRGIMMRSIIQPNNRGLEGVKEDVHKLLKPYAKRIRNKARNITLDQTRKTYNNLNKGRMEAVGLKKFQWVHSGGGEKPRELHLFELNGKIFSFDNLPIIDERTGERGIPGQAINCRCSLLPIIEFENGEPNG